MNTTPNSRAVPRQTRPKRGLSLVVPAWHEAENLSKTLERHLPALEKQGDPFEVIVVSDGPQASVLAAATRFASRGVRILNPPNRLGKGGAILAGLRVARYEYVGFLDTAGPISPSELHRLLASLMRGDGIIAAYSAHVGPSGFFQGVGQVGQDWLLRALPAAGGAVVSEAVQSMPEWARIGTTAGAIGLFGTLAAGAKKRLRGSKLGPKVGDTRPAVDQRKRARRRGPD